MTESRIEWTEATWNPVRGCRRVSRGCENCYAERQAHRFSGTGKPYEGLTKLRNGRPGWTGEARFVPEMLDKPLRWREPRLVFVNSMSDLFHEDVTDEQIAAVFGVMAACYPRHTFQILTKRPARMLKWFRWVEAHGCHPETWCLHCASNLVDTPPSPPVYRWPLSNVWLGVSVEDQATADERIPLLLQTPAAVRWVSAEPLLDPIEMPIWLVDDLHQIGRAPRVALDWVVVGGEAGPVARECRVEWVRSIVEQCRSAGVSCFVKQLGSRALFELDDLPEHIVREFDATHGYVPDRCFPLRGKGNDMSDWPEDIRVREWP